jgi:hypothetical protein
MKKKKQELWGEFGYKVIFACKYPTRKVNEILRGHIEEAMAELGVCYNTSKKGVDTIFIKMSENEIDLERENF